MTASVTIRDITPDDTDVWLQMRQLLWPTYDPAQLATEIQEFLGERDRWGLFLAEVDGVAAGFVECRLRDSAAGCSTQGVGYLEGWFVDSNHRRCGVGAALVQQAEEWSRAQGATEMASDTTTEYPDSLFAHGALGYTEVKRRFLFRKDL